MSVGVVIPAAGQGKRMGTKESKQFLGLDQEPILIHTLRVFNNHSEIDEIVLAVHENELVRVEHLVQEFDLSKVTKIVTGGEERQDSVYQGLLACQSEWVLIHDAVRPFIDAQIISRVISEVKKREAVIVAVPSKDTVKEVREGMVVGTPDRKYIWNVQTPQAFRRDLLIQANQFAMKENLSVTDDASIMEHFGQKVYIVMGSYQNIKITTPEDLIFAKAILETRRIENAKNRTRI